VRLIGLKERDSPRRSFCWPTAIRFLCQLRYRNMLRVWTDRGMAQKLHVLLDGGRSPRRRAPPACNNATLPAGLEAALWPRHQYRSLRQHTTQIFGPIVRSIKLRDRVIANRDNFRASKCEGPFRRRRLRAGELACLAAIAALVTPQEHLRIQTCMDSVVVVVCSCRHMAA